MRESVDTGKENQRHVSLHAATTTRIISTTHTHAAPTTRIISTTHTHPTHHQEMNQLAMEEIINTQAEELKKQAEELEKLRAQLNANSEQVREVLETVNATPHTTTTTTTTITITTTTTTTTTDALCSSVSQCSMMKTAVG